MLYGTNPSRSSGESQDHDLDYPGLAAVTSTRRPGVITGGGGYGTQGSGGGGTPGPGETPVAGSRGSGYHPVDRSVSMQALAVTGKARYAFQKSGRGSKIPISEAEGTSGLGDIFGWIKARVTPPGGKISRVQIIPKQVREAIPTPVRKFVRYTGAGVQSVFAPVLSGSQQRRIFGLDAGESAAFMKTQQASRIAIGTIATFGGAKALLAAKAVSPLTYTAPVGSKLGVAYLPASATFATPGYATAATFAAPVAPVASGSASLIAASSTQIPGAAFAPVAASAPSLAITPAATIAAKAGLGTQFLTGTGSVLKAIGIGVGAQALLGLAAPRPAASPEQIAPPSDISAQGYAPSAGGPGGGGEAAGGGEGGQMPMLASGGLVAAGLAVGALVYQLTRSSRRGRK